MKNLHFAQIGSQFRVERFLFRSTQNLLEYDFIVISLAALTDELNGSPIEFISNRVRDLKDFITTKKLPIVFFHNGSDHFIDQVKIRRKTLDFFDIKSETIRERGRKIDSNKHSLFAEFINRTEGVFEYRVCFSEYLGTSIGTAKGKTKPVGFYNNEFVVLPSLNGDAEYNNNLFLTELFEVCKKIGKSNNNELELPQWTNEYTLPGEKEDQLELKEIEKQIAELQKAKISKENQLASYQSVKRLWTESGAFLEEVVKETFKELGFNVLHSDLGRDDILMDWKGRVIVGEIKGLTKSAAEKNAAQLEKWAAIHYANTDVKPKAILIVNTFRNLPLDERIEKSFPTQMLPYSESRHHLLMTTLQLCNLLLFCRKYPEKKDAMIEKLLDTIGEIKEFNQWDESIEGPDIKKNIASSKKKIPDGKS